MPLQDDYIEALNNCIERLAAGESLETILADYPTMANDLRPMLAACSLISQIRVPAAEVLAAQNRVLPKVQAAVQPGAGMMGYWAVLLIVALLGGIAFAWQSQSQQAAPTETLEQTAESSPEATTELTAEATSEATAAPLITLEGTVESINVNVITIFDMEIALAEDDPLLGVIQIGDVLRIEGEYRNEIFIAIIIVFVDADVEIQNGEVWRDTGDCSNPPPPWAPANGWRRRCEGGGAGGNGNGRGNGRGGSS